MMPLTRNLLLENSFQGQLPKQLKIVLTWNEMQRNEEFYFDSPFLRILTVGKHFVLPRIYKPMNHNPSVFFAFVIHKTNCDKT